MNTKHNAAFGLCLAASLILGSVQGNRIHTILENEIFFRWLLSAGTQIPMANDERLVREESADSVREVVDPMDDELFSAIEDLAEEYLPEAPVAEERDISRLTGEPYSKLIRAARMDGGSLDDALWKMAKSPELSGLRSDFIGYLESNRLQSASPRFAASWLYPGENNQMQGVGVTSLFFGFRKVAANFLWLQVDKFWHEGQLHRMVPMMRTCVALDPSFVDAYLLGAWHLAYNITAKLEITPEELKVWSPRYQRYMGVRDTWYFIGAEFLKGGAWNNPRDYRLYFDLGYAIYENKIEDHENAVRYIGEAQRQWHDRWVDRMLYMVLMRSGEYEKSNEGWEWYMDPDRGGFPEHYAGTRFIQVNNAFLAEIRQAEALECAEAARAYAAEAQQRGDGAEAQKARAAAEEFDALAKVELADATAIWKLLDQRGDDSLAASRLALIDARDLWREGRWVEALANLNSASFLSITYFDDLADLMIEIKLSIPEDDPYIDDLVITTSERLEIERRARVADRATPVKNRKRRVTCDYIHDEDAA